MTLRGRPPNSWAFLASTRQHMTSKNSAQSAPDQRLHVITPPIDGSRAHPAALPPAVLTAEHPKAHPPYAVVAHGVDLLVVNILGRLHWQMRQVLDLLQQ